MEVHFLPYYQEFIDKKIAAGEYENVSDLLQDAIQLLIEADYVQEAKLRDLRQAIEDGINSGPPEPWDIEEIKREGRALYEAKQAENKVKVG